MKYLIMFALAGLFAHGAACKTRGTVSVSLDGTELCADDATHVVVYLIPNQNCDSCACGSCIVPCSGDGCILACDGYCTMDELREGISVTPPRAGQYAAVYQLVSRDSVPPVEIAVACSVVTVDADGTSDITEQAHGMCCTGDGADAGAVTEAPP